MFLPLDEATLVSLKSPQLKEEAREYLKIQEDFYGQIRRLGFELAPESDSEVVQEVCDRLQKKGAVFSNGGRSIWINQRSPACRACERGLKSRTFFISFQCNRDCYFCFNHAMKDYGFYLSHERDYKADLLTVAKKMPGMEFIGLSGGEPLMHPEKVLDFFKTARQTFPGAYTRLYTNGDFADPSILKALSNAGLDEIRFSIKMEDFFRGRTIFGTLAEAKRHIPQVLVEMPIEPDTKDAMRAILKELDRLGLFGINLLEMLCSLVHPGAFKERGFKIKNPPWDVLYDYWYPGTVPIAGSELVCLEILEFALDTKLSLGVHYCSGENKHTAQLYRQNTKGPIPRTHTLSPSSLFLVSAKLYGKDALEALQVFKKKGIQNVHYDPSLKTLEFPVSLIPSVPNPEAEVGVVTSILEPSSHEVFIRDLKLKLTTPSLFDPQKDL